MPSRWPWPLGTPDEGAQLRLRVADPAGVCRQAMAEIPCVPPQTVSRAAFEVVPDLRCRIELRCIRWELFQVPPGVGLAHRLDGWPPVNRAPVPEPDKGSSKLPQERAQEGGDVQGLEVARLEAEVSTQVLALGRNSECRQCREASMFVVVGDDGGMPHGRPGAATGGDEQEAALIQNGEMGPKSLGVFFGPARGRAASGRWPARPVGGRAAPAPDRSPLSGARASSRARDDSAPQSAPESSPRCAVRSTARSRTHAPGPPGVRAAPTVHLAGRSAGAVGLAPAWGLTPPRPRLPRRAAIDTLTPPTRACGERPRSSSGLRPGVLRPGVGAVPRFRVIHRVSWTIGKQISLTYAILNRATA
jgi:hypothetical protein